MDSSHLQCTRPVPFFNEIRRGRDLLLKLRDLTDKASPSNASAATGTVCDGDLVNEVLGSLTGTLSSMLTSTVKPSDETNPSCRKKRGRTWTDTKSLTGGKRSRRYSQYETKVTNKPDEDDGYVWNKYGQKIILGARHQRSYYKCSQKTDQGCPATKQVQRSNDNPSMFVVTYIGKHCCQQTIYLSADDDESSTVHDHSSNRPFSITFGKSIVNSNYHPLPPMSESAHRPFPFTKKLPQQLKKPTVPQNNAIDVAVPEVICPTDLMFENPESSWENDSNYSLDKNLFDDVDDFDFKSFWAENEDLELLLNSS